MILRLYQSFDGPITMKFAIMSRKNVVLTIRMNMTPGSSNILSSYDTVNFQSNTIMLMAVTKLPRSRKAL